MILFINRYIGNIFKFFGYSLRCMPITYMYNPKKNLAVYEIPMYADRYLALKKKGFKTIDVWEFKKICKRQKKANHKLTQEEIDFLFE